jgi:hypothetical protein
MNMTYIKSDSFGSQFNSDWASMLLIAIDEVFFDKKEITERLKYLSTTDKDKIEAKGKERKVKKLNSLQNLFFVPIMKIILFK